MNYPKAITDQNYLNQLISESISPRKGDFTRLLRGPLKYIQSEDDFCEKHFIQRLLKTERHSEDFETRLDSHNIYLRQLLNDSNGNWEKNDVIDLLNGGFVFPANCALMAIVECLKGLNSAKLDLDNLLRATKFESNLPLLEAAFSTLMHSDKKIISRQRGLEKSRKKNKKKSPTVALALQLAEKVWEAHPEASINVVARLIHVAIDDVFTKFREDKCLTFITLGLYDEHTVSKLHDDESVPEQAHRFRGAPHPVDSSIICVPVILENPDAIRYHIKKIKPKIGSNRSSDELCYKIDDILAMQIRHLCVR